MPTIFLDTETTGLDPEKCYITELAVISDSTNITVDGNTLDEFIKIPEDAEFPIEVQEKTHITPEMLSTMGKDEGFMARLLHSIMSKDDTVVVTHNCQFDISFIECMFNRYGLELPTTCRYLDTLTVARDCLPIPHHRLENCLEFFKITDQQNTHRAIDDTKALESVFTHLYKYLVDNKIDIEKYINVWGYLSYFGVPKYKINGIKYLPQDPKRGLRVYEHI